MGVIQYQLHLMFGMSLTNCMHRKTKLNLLKLWMCCTKEDTLNIVPAEFIDRIMALEHLPFLQFDSDNVVDKQVVCALLLVESTLASIHPTCERVDNLVSYSATNNTLGQATGTSRRLRVSRCTGCIKGLPSNAVNGHAY